MVLMTEFVYPTTTIHHMQENTHVILDKIDLGRGTLYISESSVSWKSTREPNPGFNLHYEHITLHGISSDPQLYDDRCIFMMTDIKVILPLQLSVNTANVTPTADENEDEDGSEEESDGSEIVIGLDPESISAVEAIYDAICKCQALNPDTDESDDDDVYEDVSENFEDVEIRNVRNQSSRDNPSDMSNLEQQMKNQIDIIADEIYEDAD